MITPYQLLGLFFLGIAAGTCFESYYPYNLIIPSSISALFFFIDEIKQYNKLKNEQKNNKNQN